MKKPSEESRRLRKKGGDIYVHAHCCQKNLIAANFFVKHKSPPKRAFIFSIYVDEENSPTVAYVETKDLINFIQSDLANVERDKYGDEYFSCRWIALEKCGYLKYIVDLPF